jgi:hypothetical protein
VAIGLRVRFGSSSHFLTQRRTQAGLFGLVVWALGAIAGAVNIEIKSYIEDVLKIVKECLLKRGNPKAQRATSTSLGALPTSRLRSDPTC